MGLLSKGKAPVLPQEREKHLRANRVAYYSKCELLNYQPKPFNHAHRGGKAKRKRAEDEDLSDTEPSNSPASLFLQIQ